MRCHFGIGVWELFLPGIRAGTLYKYEIKGANGDVLPLKADPLALRAEHPPSTASIVGSLSPSPPDADWAQRRAELQRIGGLGAVVWQGTPHTAASVCRLYPPQWVRERLVHGITPHEASPPPAVLTGTELRAWRKAKGWTQATVARELGVSVRSIERAEARGTKPLTRALRTVLDPTRPTPPPRQRSSRKQR